MKLHKITSICRLITFISPAIITAILMTACSDDSLIPGHDDDRITFNVKENKFWSPDFRTETRSTAKGSVRTVQMTGCQDNPLFLVPLIDIDTFPQSKIASTRSTLTDAANIDSFGVYAGFADKAGTSTYAPDYMTNLKVTHGNDEWTTEGKYFWPGEGSLHFNAYSPYYSGSTSDNGDDTGEGITGINNMEGNLLLNYSTPADNENQLDLLFATPVDASSSPCELTFNHALTGIRFAAGAELAPCVIKKITISGIMAQGTLNIESGQWSALTNEADFTLDLNVSLPADANSKYVAQGTSITSETQTFLLIPQTFGENAGISIEADFNGKAVTLSADLTAQTWPMGRIITYRISANPDSEALTLDAPSDINTKYTGSEFTFNVKSSLNKDGEATPVKWIAQFVDDNGNVISQPGWIKSITLSGTGDTEAEGVTIMQDIVFDKMTERTRKLQNASDINTSSGNNPYNLASSTGAASVENTANTYIINAPGTYSLPLVYGNAITNGTTNAASYSISTHGRDMLTAFTNHLGNAISSPYIYENTGCTPANAVLIWEDELNLVRNVRLSTDKKSLIVDIPHNTIRQGNAMVAVRDADGNVMWSWQLWVTDFVAAQNTRNITISGTTYGLFEENLGYVEAGDVIRFPECSVKLRITQTDVPDGLEPLTKTVTITQTGTVIANADYNPYYQWGRKDPMMSNVQQWYDGDNQEITVLPTAAASSAGTTSLIKSFILNPQTFFLASHGGGSGSSDTEPYPYKNLWNIGQNNKDVKTVYDPSPAGYVVPFSQPFTYLSGLGKVTSGQSPTNPDRVVFSIDLGDGGAPLIFPAMGYRHSTGDGMVEADNIYATYWSSHALNVKEASDFNFSNSHVPPTLTTGQFAMFMAFSIRPVKEN